MLARTPWITDYVDHSDKERHILAYVTVMIGVSMASGTA